MMDRDEAFDERALLERVRERLRSALGEAPLPPAAARSEPTANASNDALDAELAEMAAAADVADAPLRSYRRLLGPLLTFARRVARKLLAGPLEKQASYNAANRRLANAYRRELDSLRRDYEALRKACEILEARVRQLESGSIGR